MRYEPLAERLARNYIRVVENSPEILKVEYRGISYTFRKGLSHSHSNPNRSSVYYRNNFWQYVAENNSGFLIRFLYDDWRASNLRELTEDEIFVFNRIAYVSI